MTRFFPSETSPPAVRGRRRGPPAFLVWVLGCGIFLHSAVTGSQAVSRQTPPVTEYQLKAVFLFNFAQFVDWSPSAFSDPQAPFVIGILGDDPFGKYLDDIVRGERINGRPLIVLRSHHLDDLKHCHILFVSRSEQKQIEHIVGEAPHNVLTVSDISDFAQHGGIIGFVMDHNKVRLRINLDAAKAADVTISSKLLRPADIVTTTSD